MKFTINDACILVDVFEIRNILDDEEGVSTLDEDILHAYTALLNFADGKDGENDCA